MGRSQTRRAIEVFRAAVELSEPERRVVLERECGSDAELRAEVESLLANDAADWSELDRPVVGGVLHTALSANEEVLSGGFVAAGRYRIVERLGEGGMGIVYRAEQDHPQREVALKVMRSGSAELLRRFEREIRILARLQHPGIAQIHDAGRMHTPGGQRAYLAMELVRGEAITAFVARRRLDVPARLSLMASVCDAVQHAHQSGVIHRDLKPDNILVEEAAGGARPRVLDFGVSALTDPTAVTLATEPGAMVGTLAYMAPEQVSGRAGTQSDVYALGVILYELLCGVLPIDVRGEALASAIRRIERERPVPASRHDGRLSGDLETILGKALEKEPGVRYASADALGSDIRRYLQHEPILARPANAAYVLRRFARRHRLLVSVAAVSLLAVFGALAITSLSLVRARSAERRALGLARVLAERALPMLTDQVGTKAEREALAKELHSTAASLLDQAPDDPLVLSVYADSLRQLSRLALDAGRYDETLRLCQEALAARERAIAGRGREDLKLESARSIDMVLVGDMYRALGEFEAGLAWYERAREQHVRLVAREPSADHLEHLAWSEQRLAYVAEANGRLEEAIERCAEFLSLSRRVLDLRPNDLTALDGWREAHVLKARIHLALNEERLAREYLEQGLSIGRQLLAADPGNRIYLRGMVASLIGAFSYYPGDEWHERRRELAAEALPVAERFYNGDPTDATAASQLAVLLAQTSVVAEVDGDLELAEQHIDRAMALCARVSSQRRKHDAPSLTLTYERAREFFHRVGRLEDSRVALGLSESARAQHQTASVVRSAP